MKQGKSRNKGRQAHRDPFAPQTAAKAAGDSPAIDLGSVSAGAALAEYAVIL
ncbi:hypothetical protein ACFOGJ_27285 [Marinibaculum pumilum]|uniref:Uncharacterized protein n=1 Tax=Marinibaculum pumilum TaxID=1766165 RepID=A0ABV7L8L3_9PROT